MTPCSRMPLSVPVIATQGVVEGEPAGTLLRTRTSRISTLLPLLTEMPTPPLVSTNPSSPMTLTLLRLLAAMAVAPRTFRMSMAKPRRRRRMVSAPNATQGLSAGPATRFAPSSVSTVIGLPGPGQAVTTWAAAAAGSGPSGPPGRRITAVPTSTAKTCAAPLTVVAVRIFYPPWRRAAATGPGIRSCSPAFSRCFR